MIVSYSSHSRAFISFDFKLFEWTYRFRDEPVLSPDESAALFPDESAALFVILKILIEFN